MLPWKICQSHSRDPMKTMARLKPWTLHTETSRSMCSDVHSHQARLRSPVFHTYKDLSVLTYLSSSGARRDVVGNVTMAEVVDVSDVVAAHRHGSLVHWHTPLLALHHESGRIDWQSSFPHSCDAWLVVGCGFTDVMEPAVVTVDVVEAVGGEEVT